MEHLTARVPADVVEQIESYANDRSIGKSQAVRQLLADSVGDDRARRVEQLDERLDRLEKQVDCRLARLEEQVDEIAESDQSWL